MLGEEEMTTVYWTAILVKDLGKPPFNKWGSCKAGTKIALDGPPLNGYVWYRQEKDHLVKLPVSAVKDITKVVRTTRTVVKEKRFSLTEKKT